MCYCLMWLPCTQCLCLDGRRQQLVMKLLGVIIMQQHDKHVHSCKQQQQQQQQQRDHHAAA